GEKAAKDMAVPLLGTVPLDPRMVEAGDAGKPLVALDKNSAGARAFQVVARNLAAQISIANYNESQVRNRPKEMHLHDQNPPKIVWDDGAILEYDARALRMVCPCAACRDEITGTRTLRESDVPDDVKIVETRPV